MDNTIRQLRTDDHICKDDGNRERTITDLAQAARTGDRAAWDEIVFRYDGVVRATVARYRLQQSDAADATQNTWLRAVARIATLRNPERLGSWLATTAARECLAVLRRARREFPSEASVEIVWAGAGPETALLQEERNRVIDANVAELPILRRQLVDALFRDPESTYAKVAQLTRMPIGSIGPTRSRVLLALRRRMRRDGFGLDDLVA
jgi:RNA polymerase sigma factor (sigma-70 family)